MASGIATTATATPTGIRMAGDARKTVSGSHIHSTINSGNSNSNSNSTSGDSGLAAAETGTRTHGRGRRRRRRQRLEEEAACCCCSRGPCRCARRRRDNRARSSTVSRVGGGDDGGGVVVHGCSQAHVSCAAPADSSRVPRRRHRSTSEESSFTLMKDLLRVYRHDPPQAIRMASSYVLQLIRPQDATQWETAITEFGIDDGLQLCHMAGMLLPLQQHQESASSSLSLCPLLTSSSSSSLSSSSDRGNFEDAVEADVDTLLEDTTNNNDNNPNRNGDESTEQKRRKTIRR